MFHSFEHFIEHLYYMVSTRARVFICERISQLSVWNVKKKLAHSAASIIINLLLNKKEPKIISWLISLMWICLPLHTLACLHFKLFVQRVWMCVDVCLFRGDSNIFNVIQNVTHKTTGAHAHTACTEHYPCISFKLSVIPTFVCCWFLAKPKLHKIWKWIFSVFHLNEILTSVLDGYDAVQVIQCAHQWTPLNNSRELSEIK